LDERRTIAGSVAETLRDAIQSGVLQDGIELNQVALAEHFGTSRVPVREAMRTLESEGWISARAHHRAVVQALSADHVEQIFELRLLLETQVIGKVIRRVDAAQIKKLYRLCDAMDGMKEHNEWVKANRQFHHMLLEAPQTEVMTTLIGQLTSQIERYLRLRGGGPIRESQAGDEHRAIVAAVERRDAKTARDLIKEHISNTKDLVCAAMRKQVKTVSPYPELK
jgi:DNA-binding GntR family transcriptional regulator